jgi:hypothetical protein
VVWKLAVRVTSLCVCGVDLAVCAAAGDVRSGDPWFRVGNLLRANPDATPPSDRESGH